MFPTRRGLVVAQGAGGAAGRDGHAGLLEERREFAQHALVKTGEAERRFDRDHGLRWRQTAGPSGGDHLREHAAREIHGRALRAGIAGDASVGGTALIEVVDLHHQLDRRDAADGVGRKHAEPQRDGADQLAVDVDGAAAHSSRDIGANGLAAHLADDDVLAGTPLILQNPDDFDGKRLGLRAGQHGPGIPFHAGPEVGLLENLGLSDLGPHRRRIRDLGEEGRTEDYGEQRRCFIHGTFLGSLRNCTVWCLSLLSFTLDWFGEAWVPKKARDTEDNIRRCGEPAIGLRD